MAVPIVDHREESEPGSIPHPAQACILIALREWGHADSEAMLTARSMYSVEIQYQLGHQSSGKRVLAVINMNPLRSENP